MPSFFWRQKRCKILRDQSLTVHFCHIRAPTTRAFVLKNTLAALATLYSVSSNVASVLPWFALWNSDAIRHHKHLRYCHCFAMNFNNYFMRTSHLAPTMRTWNSNTTVEEVSGDSLVAPLHWVIFLHSFMSLANFGQKHTKSDKMTGRV